MSDEFNKGYFNYGYNRSYEAQQGAWQRQADQRADRDRHAAAMHKIEQAGYDMYRNSGSSQPWMGSAIPASGGGTTVIGVGVDRAPGVSIGEIFEFLGKCIYWSLLLYIAFWTAVVVLTLLVGMVGWAIGGTVHFLCRWLNEAAANKGRRKKLHHVKLRSYLDAGPWHVLPHVAKLWKQLPGFFKGRLE